MRREIGHHFQVTGHYELSVDPSMRESIRACEEKLKEAFEACRVLKLSRGGEMGFPRIRVEVRKESFSELVQMLQELVRSLQPASSRKLYKFNISCGRYGDISGVFIEDERRVAQLIGRVVLFYEVLGKHSEIEREIKAEHFTVLSDDPDIIRALDPLHVGVFPFDHIPEPRRDCGRYSMAKRECLLFNRLDPECEACDSWEEDGLAKVLREREERSKKYKMVYVGGTGFEVSLKGEEKKYLKCNDCGFEGELGDAVHLALMNCPECRSADLSIFTCTDRIPYPGTRNARLMGCVCKKPYFHEAWCPVLEEGNDDDKDQEG